MAKKILSGPLPLAKLEKKVARRIRGIFFDIDDTFSLHGKIPAAASAALWAARKAGLRLIPVTGRPAGWVDHIARMWPVDAVVGENGAFYFHLDSSRGRDGKLVRRFVQDAPTRAKNRERLHKLFEELRVKIPQLALASDQAYREIDIAIDFCEDVERLSDRAIQEVIEHFQHAGAQAKLSSIHVNAWFGDHDKYSTCRILMKEIFQESFDEVRGEYLYLGDSPNDEPFFHAIPQTIGVANVKDFLPFLRYPPRFITKKPGGEGFAEAVKKLLSLRGKKK
jgi:HAD superfamily hydrolase (TIGR01484 family)